jgi:hypothetical protein
MSHLQGYPPDWPRCPACDDFALDGHITCGRAECDESGQREIRALSAYQVRAMFAAKDAVAQRQRDRSEGEGR